MTDIVFLNPGEPNQIYQDLSNEFTAIEPPAFAGLFATYARRKGARVAVVDAPALGLSAEAAARLVADELKPRLCAIAVYGFQPSASTQNMTSAGKIARLIKEAAPGIKVLMTGTHPAALPERTMREEAVDFVCDLEGPATIYNTWAALAAGESDFAKVASLWWREDGHIRRPLAAEPLLADLDGAMPGIAWDLLPMERYRAHNWHAFADIDARQPYAAIHTTLGCPYKCTFCCINAPFGKSSYRMWKPETVIAEIDHLVQRYGVKNIKIVDEMFVLNRRHVHAICDLLIERGYDLNIWAYARIDTVHDEFLDKLRRAGIRWLALGIESASADVRDGAQKQFKQDDIRATVRRIRDAGVYVLGNYIFGLPDDTLERMQETLDLALELNTEFANLYSAMAYPGSRLYDEALRHGWELPEAWHHYSQHGYNTKPLPTRFLSPADIVEFRDRAWTRYFTNPAYIAMIGRTFGPAVVAHVERMTAMPLKRRLVEQKYAA
ncbi:MAG: hypothetical protein OHK0024_35350 [Thalassobaculales bacterium]